MTIYHVRAGGQGEGGTLPSLGAAAKLAKTGDEVVVHGGVYREMLRPGAGTTWQAAEGERPVIDLGWDNKPTNSSSQNGVLINAPGVVVRGFEIRNVSGNGIGIAAGGDDCLIEDCEIHHTVSGGLSANGTGTPIRNTTIRGCYVHDISLSGRWRETPVNGCFLFKSCDGVLVEDTRIERGHGEGMAAGTRSRNLVFRRVTVARMTHLLVYASNRAQDVLLEDCVFYQMDDDEEFRQGDGDIGGGIVVGDEVAPRSLKWQHAENVTVRRCIVINAGSGFWLRNQVKTVGGNPDGYETTIQNLLVENCTFIAGSNTKNGVDIRENERPGGVKVRGVFRNNLFVFDRLPAGAGALKSNAPGVSFEDNGWSDAVPAGARGEGNIGIDAREALVAPFATVADFNIDNYRPVAGGPLDGAGIGALEPLPVEPPPVVDPPPDPEPEPEPVDWDALFERAAAVGVQLATIGAALADAREQVAVASLAQDAAAGELAGLLAALDEATRSAAN